MITSFTISRPAAMARCGLLDPCNRVVVALDGALESTTSIGTAHHAAVYLVRNNSSHLYDIDLGFPLSISVRLTDDRGNMLGGKQCTLHADTEVDEADGWLNNGPDGRKDGSVDEVVSWLCAGIVDELKSQFSPV